MANTHKVVNTAAIAEELRAERARLESANPEPRPLVIGERLAELDRLISRFGHAPSDIRRVIVLAGNATQAHYFVGCHDLRDVSIIVRSADSLRGLTLRHAMLVRIGTWAERPDIEEIEDHLAIMAASEPLTVRDNPPMPSDAQLYEMFTLNGSGALGLIPALRAIWRNGCDTGMVAP